MLKKTEYWSDERSWGLMLLLLFTSVRLNAG